MIYTVTLNPSIDMNITTDKLITGSVNRSKAENYCIGGKGINVSMMLNNLGIDSVALGFTAGFTGNEIKKSLSSCGIKTDFVHIQKGFSRINVKLISDGVTEINGNGPEITADNLDDFLQNLKKINNGDYIVLAGSIPKSVPQNIYENILSELKDKNIKSIVDTTGNSLLSTLKYRPFLIKPNNFELSEIFEKELVSTEEIICCAKQLQQKGAVNVLVSMAEKGSVLVDEYGNSHSIGIAQGKTVNTVGCGDSMVAGFTAGYIKKSDYTYALKLATACGAATAFSENLGSREKIMNILSTL